MKKFTLILVLLIAATAVAVEDNEAMYVGGSGTNIKPETMGSLNTTSEQAIVFENPSGNLAIKYSQITKYFESEELARHLGVAPTIVVGLIKHRQRRHFLHLEYRDDEGKPQAAVFEVGKHMPPVLMAILESRVSKNKPTSQAPVVAQQRG